MRAVHELTRGPLPSPGDYEVPIPPVFRAWCRRITGHNVWLFYRTNAEAVFVLFVTRTPPVPLAEL
jgi:hypothetical protein